MRLKDIQGQYDFVVSLGASCQTAYQIQTNNLRCFSGPLDWFVCNSLHRLNVALLDKLSHIMQREQLIEEGIHEDKLSIRDKFNDILSVHDFPINCDFDTAYQTFRETLDRRINRLFMRLSEANSVLFVRTQAYSADDLYILRHILKLHTSCDFKILAVNYTEENRIIEHEWGLENTVVVEIPCPQDRWQGDDEAWKQILTGITIKND